jgi:hypothetical protein
MVFVFIGLNPQKYQIHREIIKGRLAHFFVDGLKWACEWNDLGYPQRRVERQSGGGTLHIYAHTSAWSLFKRIPIRRNGVEKSPASTQEYFVYQYYWLK